MCLHDGKSVCRTEGDETYLLLVPFRTRVLSGQERSLGSYGNEPSTGIESFIIDSGIWNLSLSGDDAGGTIRFVSKNCRTLTSCRHILATNQ